MAKEDTAVAAAAAQAAAEVAAPVETLSLDEFCSRLSETVRSPEMIGGFHYTERAANTLRDTFEAFKARFDVFVNKPV